MQDRRGVTHAQGEISYLTSGVCAALGQATRRTDEETVMNKKTETRVFVNVVGELHECS